MAVPGTENGISLKRVGTVIIASDAPSLRAEVAAALGEPGTDLVEVYTGQDVAGKVKEHTPELVAVDMQMGNMGAMAVCMELRLEASYGNLPEVPVLMLVDRRGRCLSGTAGRGTRLVGEAARPVASSEGRGRAAGGRLLPRPDF